MNEELDEEVDRMCNISTMYIDQGRKQGLVQGAMNEKISTILELAKMNLPVDMIAKATHITTSEVTKIIKENTLPAT